MSVWTSPSPSDFDRWRKRVLAGANPSEAARALGFKGSSSFKRADPARHAEILEEWRELRRPATDSEAAGAVAAGRETIAEKAQRLLASGRLTVERVDHEIVRATCEGDHGRYSLSISADRSHCTCPARVRTCAHRVALRLVVGTREHVPRARAEVGPR